MQVRGGRRLRGTRRLRFFEERASPVFASQQLSDLLT